MALVLTACGGDGEAQAEPAPTVTVTETVTATPEPTEPEESPAEEEAESEVEAPSANHRGNIAVSIGSEHGLLDPDMTPFVTWSTLDIVSDPSCNRISAVPPDGHLVGLELEVAVEETFYEENRDGFFFNSPNFEIFDQDGTFLEEDPATHAANNCLADEDKLTSGGTRPGVTETGTIVLESPVKSGLIVYRDVWSQEHYEWEF